MILIGARLQGYTKEGSLAIKDTTFINCFWPKLDRPTRIFSDGSTGLKVMGATPRNVWFPDDIEFLDYYPDALYPAEQAVLKAFPYRRALVNLAPQEADVWLKAYEEAVKLFPPTCSISKTPRHVNFLRHYEEKSRRDVVLTADAVSELPDGSRSIMRAGAKITKIEYEEFVAELTPEESEAVAAGKKAPAKNFVHISEKNDDKSPVTLQQWKTR